MHGVRQAMASFADAYFILSNVSPRFRYASICAHCSRCSARASDLANTSNNNHHFWGIHMLSRWDYIRICSTRGPCTSHQSLTITYFFFFATYSCCFCCFGRCRHLETGWRRSVRAAYSFRNYFNQSHRSNLILTVVFDWIRSEISLIAMWINEFVE